MVAGVLVNMPVTALALAVRTCQLLMAAIKHDPCDPDDDSWDPPAFDTPVIAQQPETKGGPDLTVYYDPDYELAWIEDQSKLSKPLTEWL